MALSQFHHGAVALRRRHPLAARQRLLVCSAHEPVPVRGRLGVHQHRRAGFWDAFTVFLDRPELLIDERFGTNAARMLNRDALHALIADALAPLPKQRIARRAEECRIPLGVVQSFDDVLADAHLAARDMWQPVRRTRGGGVLRSPRPSWRVAGEPWPALALGDPTAEAATAARADG